MEDIQIIELYWQRNEQAIAETSSKYGVFCFSIAKNILSVHEDAEECVNDTYHQVWNVIPPQRPIKFRPWLGKIVRNIALLKKRDVFAIPLNKMHGPRKFLILYAK